MLSSHQHGLAHHQVLSQQWQRHQHCHTQHDNYRLWLQLDQAAGNHGYNRHCHHCRHYHHHHLQNLNSQPVKITSYQRKTNFSPAPSCKPRSFRQEKQELQYDQLQALERFK